MFNQTKTNQTSNNDQSAQDVLNLPGLHDMNKGPEFPFKRVEDKNESDGGAKLTATDVQDIFAVSNKNKQEAQVERPLGVVNAGVQGFEQNRADQIKTQISKKPQLTGQNLPKGMTYLQDAHKSRFNFKKLLIPLAIVLFIAILGLVGFWAYSKYFVNKNDFEELKQEENGLSSVLKNLSDELKDVDKDADLNGSNADNADRDSNQQQQEYIPPVDTDGDGLSDAEELNLGANPGRVDTDFDGLSDWDEINKYKTSPINSDSDGDGYLDGIEVQNGYNPLGAGKLVGFDETNSWQNYLDSENRFEFKYPLNWEINNSGIECAGVYDFKPANIQLIIFNACWKDSVGGERLTFSETFKKFRDSFTVNNIAIDQKKTINNIDIEIFKNTILKDNGIINFDSSSFKSVALWQKNDTGYILIDNDNQYQENNIFNNILYTFRFLE